MVGVGATFLLETGRIDPILTFRDQFSFQKPNIGPDQNPDPMRSLDAIAHVAEADIARGCQSPVAYHGLQGHPHSLPSGQRLARRSSIRISPTSGMIVARVRLPVPSDGEGIAIEQVQQTRSGLLG
jgi:hypothetical protein